MKEKNVIELKDLRNASKTAIITIEGDGDLVLNKMNSRNTRALLADDRKKVKEQNATEKSVDLEKIMTNCIEGIGNT